jgi:hypothetical protein
MNDKAILSFSIEKEYVIRGNLLARIQNYLKDKKSFSTISSDGKFFKFFLKDKIRDEEESIQIIFEIDDKKILKTTIEIYSDEIKINEYDLQHYLTNIMFNIISNEFNQEEISYTIRNYCSYFNSIAIKGDIYLNTNYKIQLHFIVLPTLNLPNLRLSYKV